MHHKAGRWLLVVALTTAPSVGCKSGVTFWNPFAKPAPTPGSSMLQGDGDGGYIQAPQPQMAPPEPRAEEFGWTAPFKKFGDTISSPFKKSASKDKAKPVTPEDDPISLTSKQAPAGAKLYISLAQLQLKAGNVDSAIEQYEKAIEAEPKNLPALLGIAHVYDSKGDTAKALEYYKKAVKSHDQSSAAQNDLALCYYRNKQPKESIAALKKAIDLEPEKALYRNNLAKIFVELDRADEAYKTLVSVHGEAVAHYNVGYMLNDRGMKTQALEHFQAAAKLDPTLKPAQHWVKLLTTGERQPQVATTAPASRSAAAAPSQTAASAPAATAPTVTAVPKAVAATPVSRPSTLVTPAPLGPRYPAVQTPVAPTATPAVAGNAVQPEVATPEPELTAEGAASVLAAARAVAQSPLSGGPDNVARTKAAPLKTVAVPASSSNPPLTTPIPTPIVVPGRAEARSAVDSRALQAAEGPTANGPAIAPAAAPTPAPTPLPAADEEVGPRLGKKQQAPNAAIVGERYATGSRYGVAAPTVAARPTTPIQPPQGAVPPLPEQYSRTTAAQDPTTQREAAASQDPTSTRPATAARYPASRY